MRKGAPFREQKKRAFSTNLGKLKKCSDGPLNSPNRGRRKYSGQKQRDEE